VSAVLEVPTVQARQHVVGSPLHMACMGTLLRDASVHCVGKPGHEVVLLEVWLQQQVEHHPQALPLFAAWQVPDVGGIGNTTQWARQLASEMRAGDDVAVSGKGLETGNRSGTPVLRVIKPIGIRRVGRLVADVEAFYGRSKDANDA
jgi:hypothetical protein